MRRLTGQARHPSGDSEQRVTLLREAVGLWRGEPLAGLTGDWSDRMRASWAQERLGIVAAWADAEIDVGNAAGVIGRLADLTGEYPLVESLAVAYLRALQSVGRTAEAVARYAWIRDRLSIALGVEPGAELQRLHRAMLRGETPHPFPAAPAVVPVSSSISARPRRVHSLLSAARPPAASVITVVSGAAKHTSVLSRDRLEKVCADGPHRISAIKASADQVRHQAEDLLELIEDAVTARTLADAPGQPAEAQKAHAVDIKSAREAVQNALGVLAEAVVAVTDL
ncbi:hypothetical protein Q0Z83_039850 [Actinoplanes sichuanensis]|nr:hypothetical protein Q0Z83_039850 [Actinoplanes sichuanensis]